MAEADKSFQTVDSDISFRKTSMEGERDGNLDEEIPIENGERDANFALPSPLSSMVETTVRGSSSVDNTKQTTISSIDFSTLLGSQKELQDTVSSVVKMLGSLASSRDALNTSEGGRQNVVATTGKRQPLVEVPVNVSNNNVRAEGLDSPSSGSLSNINQGYVTHKPFVWKTFPDVEKFGGTDDTVRFEDWLRRFELLCQVNGCVKVEEKAKTLILALKSEAAFFIMGEANVVSWSYDQLVCKLTDRFGVNRNLAADKRSLLNRKKRKDESWQRMADDISRLAGRVFAGAPSVVTREAKDAFICALPDNLRMAIAATNPATISDCVANVTQLCSVMNIDDITSGWKKPAASSVNFSHDDKVTPQKGRRLSYPDWVKTKECWNCGEKGHLKTKCPHPPKDNKQSGKGQESQ